MICSIVLILPGCSGQKISSPEDALDGIDSFLKENGGLKQSEDITRASWYRPGDSLTDWVMMTENRAGKDTDRDVYLADLRKYVQKAYMTPEKLDRVKATEWQRIALSVVAAGGDPTCFGTAPDGTSIDLVRDGVYGWEQTKELDSQGSNALIYGLHVLEAGNVSVPENAVYSEEKILDMLLQYCEPDGGFCLGGSGSDTDITAMAVQALAHFKDSKATHMVNGRKVTIQMIIDDAVDYLSEAQSQGGYYICGDSYSAESCAQVIIALCAVGVDPRESEAFNKGGANVVDALMNFRNKDGGFASALDDYGKPEESDLLATSQVQQALVSLQLLETGNGNYYEFK